MNPDTKIQFAIKSFARRCKRLGIILEQPSEACCKVVGNHVMLFDNDGVLAHYGINPMTERCRFICWGWE
jgi:hypothetical protein